ncbi:MAG TPA: DUF481 domain-containing protein [Candidatus Dormibacteraeota bacterium]|nr:DUF481 domain-containing protein [Candidatus Dormibacteraeota bacterium]
MNNISLLVKIPRSAIATAAFLVAAGALLCPVSLRADDPKPDAAKTDAKVEEKPKPKKWDSVATVGVSLTRGNSQNFLATGSIDTKRKWTQDELLLGGSAGYGENTTGKGGNELTTKTENYIRGYGQFNHLFTERLYGGLRVTGEHDEIADLTYRLTVNPMVGYYLLKHTNSFLSAEIGPSFIDEKFMGQDSHAYWGFRAAERGEYNFKSGAKIWESVEYIPQVDDLENYLVNAEAGVAAPITKALDARLVLQDTYKNQPAPHKLKNDLKLIAAIGYKF